MSKPWHMASVRQRQPVRKYKPCAPVGDDARNRVSSMPPGIYRVLRHGALQDVVVTARGQAIERCEPETCPECRHHVCSCPPKRFPEWHGSPMMRSMAGRLALFEALAACDPEDPDGPPLFSPRERAEAISLLLTGDPQPLEKRHEAERERRGS